MTLSKYLRHTKLFLRYFVLWCLNTHCSNKDVHSNSKLSSCFSSSVEFVQPTKRVAFIIEYSYLGPTDGSTIQSMHSSLQRDFDTELIEQTRLSLFSMLPICLSLHWMVFGVFIPWKMLLMIDRFQTIQQVLLQFTTGLSIHPKKRFQLPSNRGERSIKSGYGYGSLRRTEI